MSLIVEDGTGKTNAESYISVVDATTYLVSRGEATFAAAATDAIREAALRNATDFMVAQYRFSWAGYRFTTTQNLDWPRVYVPLIDANWGGPTVAFLDTNVVPLPVQQACADLAVRALAGDLSPDIEQVARRVKVGPIEVEYDPSAPAVTVFAAVLNKLSAYFVGQGQRTTLIRT